MKLSTAILGAAGLALAVGLAAVAGDHVDHPSHAQQHSMDGPMMVPHMVAWIVDQSVENLGTTPSQRTKLESVKNRVLSGAMAMHGSHESTHAEFKLQWDSKSMDSAKLHNLVDARIEDMRRILHDSVDGLVEVHDTLTPEQRKTLSERVEAMHGSN